jgi:hypothetical protein
MTVLFLFSQSTEFSIPLVYERLTKTFLVRKIVSRNFHFLDAGDYEWSLGSSRLVGHETRNCACQNSYVKRRRRQRDAAVHVLRKTNS